MRNSSFCGWNGVLHHYPSPAPPWISTKICFRECGGSANFKGGSERHGGRKQVLPPPHLCIDTTNQDCTQFVLSALSAQAVHAPCSAHHCLYKEGPKAKKRIPLFPDEVSAPLLLMCILTFAFSDLHGRAEPHFNCSVEKLARTSSGRLNLVLHCISARLVDSSLCSRTSASSMITAEPIGM